MADRRFSKPYAFPRKQRFFTFPAVFGDISGPGAPGAWPSIEGLRTGNAGHEAAEVGYTDSHLLQNPLRGVAVRAPVGSVTKVSYGFRNGPTGATEPSVENTGVYSPATGQVGIVAAGAEEVNVSATSVVVSHTLGIKDGEANAVTIQRTGAAARTQTLQDVDDTFAYLGDIPAAYTDEQAQDAVGAMVDSSLTYVDATPLLQRAALTGDVTAAAGSNSTTIANDAVTNAKAANMAANTVKVNLTTSAADATDSAASAFSTEGSPAAGDFLWLWTDEGGGVLQQKKVDWSSLPGAGGGDTITVNGASVTDADFDDTTPAAPAGGVNVKWQKDASSPANISAYIEKVSGILMVVEAHTGDDTLTAAEAKSQHNNQGAAGTIILTLPTAAAGLEFYFYVASNFVLRIDAGAADTIEITGSTTAAAGNIKTDVVGDAVHLIAIDSTRWVAQSSHGTWTVT